MEKIITDIMSNFIMISSLIYIWYKFLNRKIEFKDPKLYVTLVSIMTISLFNYFMVNKFVRIVFITTILMIFFRFLFKEMNKVPATPLLSLAFLMAIT